MNRKNVAFALVFLGIGALMGMVFARVTGPSWVVDRGASRVERIVMQDEIRHGGREEIVIEVPELPEIPEIPVIPEIRMSPPKIIVERSAPSAGIFSVVREIIHWAGNLLALLLIVIGAALIMRQRNQPAEKAPPAPTTE